MRSEERCARLGVATRTVPQGFRRMGIFQFGRKKEGPSCFLPARIGYAVGDIHGRADLLARMFDRLEADARRAGEVSPVVVFLGDYVDRGPDSAEVIDLLLTGRPEGFERRFLKGNHEAAMLSFLDDPVANRGWLSHGGLETLASYDVHPLPSLGASGEEVAQAGASFSARLPELHRGFLESLERYVVLGDYCFVHAGIDPTRKLEAQSDTDLFWIRGRFLGDKRRLPHVVVHGHTPVSEPYQDQRRIALDTGAYFSGALSAARFCEATVSFFTVR